MRWTVIDDDDAALGPLADGESQNNPPLITPVNSVSYGRAAKEGALGCGIVFRDTGWSLLTNGYGE